VLCFFFFFAHSQDVESEQESFGCFTGFDIGDSYLGFKFLAGVYPRARFRTSRFVFSDHLFGEFALILTVQSVQTPE
jgi:hypothetical protein